MFGQKGLPAIGSRQRQVQAGQILLIVVLVIIIASTVGLSIATRSIVSLRTSTEEAESQKALAAAEAGIERAIQGSTPIAAEGSNPSNNSSYSTEIIPTLSTSFLINGGNTILKDEGTDVWFIKHKDNGDLDYTDYSSTSPNFLNLYWGSPSDGSCGSAAIQAVIVTRDSSSPNEIKSYRYAYDSCNRENNFKLADSGSYTVSGIAGITFGNKTPNNDLGKGIKDIILMQVVPIYKDTVIGISTCNPANNNQCNNPTSLPSQGYIISSTGTSGQAKRKITVFKGYLQGYLPYLSYGLFVAN